MKEKVRFESVDLLRGIAIIVMIEVHVFNSFLDPAIREQNWFHILNFINGLVAPSFLFVSGFAFYISVHDKSAELRKFGDFFFRRIKRIIQILIIGYVLHIPFYSLHDFISQINYEGWVKLSNVDVLQCIAAGLILLLLLRIMIESNRVFFITIFSLTVLIILLSPVIWKINFRNILPMPVTSYFNPGNGSLFPIFPWVGFIFAGVIIGKYFIDASDTADQNILTIKMLRTSLVIIVLSHILLSGILPETITSLIPNPLFFILRLGYVLTLLSLCALVVQRSSLRLKFIYVASRESLVIYWLHLQIIYLQIFDGKSLNDLFGYSFGILECTVAAAALIILMIAAAKLWSMLKIKNIKTARRINYAFLLILLVIFVYR